MEELKDMKVTDLLQEIERRYDDEILKAQTDNWQQGYDEGFPDGIEGTLEWIKNHQSKFTHGLAMGLEFSGVADEIRNALSK